MLTSITRPTLIVDEAKCRSNIQRMADKALASGVIFRPHFKTHQSLSVGRWVRDAGVDKITVSSLEMARQYAQDNWNDICIAFPANTREISGYNELSSRIKLSLLLDAPEVASTLSDEINTQTEIFIEVDCGYSRSGVRYDSIEQIETIIQILMKSDRLVFKGFLSHFGNTYQAENKQEIENIYDEGIQNLTALKEKYKNDFPDIITSVGDTPSCSILEDLSGADEIRPGNFVYYDLMQYYIGVCEINEIAVSVACPVVGIYPERNEIVIYGGAVHLSKESLEQDGKLFGLIVEYNENGSTKLIENSRLISISQEHGVIRTSTEFLNTVKHGDLIGILPIHSCLTADLLKNDMKMMDTGC